MRLIPEKSIRLCWALFLASTLLSCSTLPDNRNRAVSLSVGAPNAESLFSKAIEDRGDDSGFILLDNGLDAFAARAILAQSAQSSIDAQYYLLHDDIVGRLFIAQLAQAALRGVRVRLLIDDFDLANKDLGLSALDSNPNFEIRAFNPFSRRSARYWQFVSRFGSVTRRMHNKSFTVDQATTIVGGRNIGNEYFEANPAVSFGDLDVIAVGPVVDSVSESFDRYWNNELSYPISTLASRQPDPEQIEEVWRNLLNYSEAYGDSDYANAVRDSQLAAELRNDDLTIFSGSARLVADSPEKLVGNRESTDSSIALDVGQLFAEAEEEVIIFSPYFIPGDEGVTGFAALESKGVDVKVLTNSLASNNHAVVHAHYAKYRKALLRSGVELFEAIATPAASAASVRPLDAFKASTLHAKAFVVDRKRVFIGSLNFDLRSFVENTEMGMVFESEAMANEFGDWFDANIAELSYRPHLIRDQFGREELVWDSSSPFTNAFFESEPATSFWDRLKMKIYGIVPIESQL